jgi:uncharacterized membrane protein (UPF0182 family)
MKTGVKILILIGAIILVIIALVVGSKIWLNYVWFGKLGFLNVFVKIIWTKIGLWFAFFFIFLLFAGLNLLAGFRKGNIQSMRIQQGGVPVEISKSVGVVIALVILVILGLIMAGRGSSNWELILKFFNKTNFNMTDPILNKEVSFYTFTLPMYTFLKGWSLGTVILTMIAVAFLYLLSGNVSLATGKATISDQAKRHLMILMMLLAVIIAWNYWLKVYQLLFSKRGLIFGAGYTDVKVSRVTYYIMIAVSLFTAILAVLGIKKKSFKLPLIGYGLLIGGAIVITGIIPGIFQTISVKPNELVKELPYIKNNITFTRKGFNLDTIEREAFPVADSLTASDFTKGKGITKNIRLWDHRPLKATFSQIQEFRLYYDFYDVDVDRYNFDGQYRQVMLSAREINYNEIPLEAQTWVNKTLQFTHGYGLVMSPVNEIGQEGLPVLMIKDIPPKISVPIKLDRPEIYYGEETKPYVIVNTKLEEFDFPQGDTNATTRYKGPGGIPIKNSMRKFLLTIQLKSLEIIFTRYLKPDSRLMVYRSIQDRVPKIAPFLAYDSNPYLVISNGKLYWMMDAYTTTDQFPYSTPYSALQQGRYNYIRNSVKITIDAYTGDVNFYVIDNKDPLIRTYSKIFPDMFKDISEMPEDLLRHVRYPLQIFSVQAEMYSTYHMTDPQVFYNKEDKWQLPREIYGDQETAMIPYYTIIKFPDEQDKEEFVLILPFTPTNKNNMLAWMAAMSDPENYGRIIEYKFPKEKLVYGPLQIESRIDQNSEISQLFTLWGQKGSSVIRGNLLVIPVKDSLIYVEPVYLRAEQSELPELKRVIIGYQDRISIGENLEAALYQAFGAPAAPTAAAATTTQEQPKAPARETTGAAGIGELVNEAVKYYDMAQQSLREGNFAGYGDNIKHLQGVLKQLQERTQ